MKRSIPYKTFLCMVFSFACVALSADTAVVDRAASANGRAFDPDAPARLRYEVTDDLSLGAKINMELKLRENEDLDGDEDDRYIVLEPRVSLSGRYQVTPKVDVFGEVRLKIKWPLEDEADDRSDEVELELRRGYVTWRDALKDAIDIQLGRQRFKDKREWFFDENLDVALVHYAEGKHDVDLSAGSVYFDAEDDEDDVFLVVARYTFEYDKKESINLYGIIQQDDSEDNRDVSHLGVLWRGRWDDHKLWGIAALMSGEEEDHDVDGYAVDLGAVLRPDGDYRPSVIVGLAYASGDKDSEGNDQSFQQTGLEDNSGRFNGNTKFKIYGEAFDPELSNMIITTLGAGCWLSKRVSLDLVHHYYRQVENTDELRDADVEEDLTGESKDLGHEIDVILGGKMTDHLRASMKLGFFTPGSAFETTDIATLAAFELQYTF